MRTFQRILWPLLAVLSPLALLPAYFTGNWYAFFHAYSLGMALGVASFAWLAVVLALCARIPYFDRLYGHDRVLAFHGYLAGAAILAGFVHSRIKEYYLGEPENLQGMLGETALFAFLGLAALTHLFMTGHLQRYLPFTARFIARIRRIRMFDYSRVKLLHNLMAAALILVIMHVLLAGPTKENALRLWTMGCWGGAAATAYLYHALIRPLVLYRRNGRISGITEPAPGLTRVTVPETALKRPRRAGQFAYLRILSGNTGYEEHPFTFSSAPDAGSVSFTVKNLGDYSARIKNADPGTRVLVDGPYGAFTPARTSAPHLFIAGGIGITPFLSILTSWDTDGFAGPVTLVWSVRNEADLVDRDLLEGIAARHDAFTFVPVTTVAGKRIDGELLGRHVRPDTRAWFCGPEPMRRDVALTLKRLGVKRLRYERFSA